MSTKKPWHGEKTEHINLRCTPAEKIEVQEWADKYGGYSVSRYLMLLHHVNTGNVKR